LYPAPKWKKHLSPLKTIHSTKDKRQEVLWVNYDINKFMNSKKLFQ
jgi:DNA adenine methylase